VGKQLSDPRHAPPSLISYARTALPQQIVNQFTDWSLLADRRGHVCASTDTNDKIMVRKKTKTLYIYIYTYICGKVVEVLQNMQYEQINQCCIYF